MRALRPLLAGLTVAAALQGCATGRVPAGTAIQRLEAARAQSPQSAQAARALGIAYYKADRLADARTALTQAAALDPRDGTTALYLGLTAEKQGDLAAARTAYEGYLQFGRTRKIRAQLESRLAALTRLELAQAAKSAIAREASLSSQPPQPNTVAVMPLRFSGADSTLQPLERGLAELITTDLSRSSRLTVVERARLSALLAELELGRTGVADTTQGLRAGRILQAATLVQGSILQVGPERLRVDAALVNAQTAQAAGGSTQDDQLDALFSMEKRLVLDLFRALNVSLTPAERNAIEQRPTRSLAAFLAYSRGLTAEDQGKYDDASRFYNDALRIDPAFGAARQRGQETQRIEVGAQVTPATVEATAVGTTEGSVATAAQQGSVTPATTSTSTASSAANTAANLNPSAAGNAAVGTTASSAGTTGTTSQGANPPARDPVADATGSESPTPTTGRVVIVIKLPTP
ncbi:MAG TPA: CsgG/HfaB family protein [Gemmatimonadaceae bacterium]